MSETKKPAEAAANGPPDLWALVRRAEAGDEAAVPALRKLLAGSRDLVENCGSLALQVQATLVGNAAGKNLSFKEGLGFKMDQLRADLGGDNPTPLEHLLAERIALCWLSLHDAEARFSQSKDLTIKQADFWQKRIDCAHKRYLSAIKTLATVRRLAVPSLQVNIARKQVNVLAAPAAGDGAPARPTAGTVAHARNPARPTPTEARP